MVRSETRQPRVGRANSVDSVNTALAASSRTNVAVKPLSGAAVAFLTLSAALATSTSYIIQPELKNVARDLNSSLPLVSLVAASAVVGYLLGLALLVPLVDRIRANCLVAGQLSVLSLGLLIAASAPDPAVLGPASLLRECARAPEHK
jgi:predicted MFS family arabinose efflux permease